MCNNLTEALMENIVEITWMFDSLMKSGEIKPWDMLTEGYCGSDGIKAEFYQIARDFEKKYPYDTTWEDTELDYIEEIEKFAREKLIEKFGSYELKENKKVLNWIEEALTCYGINNIDVGRDEFNPEMITIYVDCFVYRKCVAEYDKCDIKALREQLDILGISDEL